MKRGFMMVGVLILLVICAASVTGAEVSVQLVPEHIGSVNGSNVTMGCASPLVQIPYEHEKLLKLCIDSESYLVDGCSPTIDTSTSNWASQLVTARKISDDPDIPFDYVLLTFGFNTAVSLTAIELDLFLCPEWNIGAPLITVDASNNSDLIKPNSSAEEIVKRYDLNQSSCDSLSTVSIPLKADSSYLMWYIRVWFPTSHEDIDWVHVGEVRFLNGPVAVYPSNGCTPKPSTGVIPTSTPTIPTRYSTVVISPTSTRNLSPSPSPIQVTPTKSASFFTSFALPSSKQELPTSRFSSQRSTTNFINPTTIKDASTSSSPPVKHSSSSTSPSTSPSTSSSTSPSTSSSTSPSTNTKPNGIEYNNLVIVLIGVIIGLIMVVIILVVVIVLCYISRKCSKKVELEPAPSFQFELKDPEPEERWPGDGINGHLSVTNPIIHVHAADGNDARYSCSNSPVARTAGRIHYDVVRDSANECLYDEIGTDAVGTPRTNDPLTDNATTTHRDNAGNEWIGVYDAVTAPVTTAAPGQNEPSQQRGVQEDEQVYAIPELPGPTTNTVEKGAMSTQPIPIYSDVRKRRIPIPKPDDFEPCVRIQPGFNENIYSENLDLSQSDYAQGSSQNSEEMEEERDPQIYAPIYTVSATAPKGFQQPLEVTSGNVKEMRELGIGQFGRVVLSTTIDLSLKDMQLIETDDNRGISVLVAVKKLRPNPTLAQQEAFYKETMFMSRLRHPNVVRLLGVSYHEPAFIMMEYMKKGDLNQFLQRYSEIVGSSSNDATQISTSTVVYMASQIASAMQYLTALNFIHRDIATRSCVVGVNFAVKIADLGVNVNLYQSHYYRVQGNTLLPIRWMATECFNGKFSEKSDVWAFGVTMWELFTLAKDKPYPHLSDEEVMHNTLKKENRQFPLRPSTCPQSVYKIMQKCWATNPKHRTSFHELVEMLQKPLS